MPIVLSFFVLLCKFNAVNIDVMRARVSRNGLVLFCWRSVNKTALDQVWAPSILSAWAALTA